MYVLITQSAVEILFNYSYTNEWHVVSKESLCWGKRVGMGEGDLLEEKVFDSVKTPHPVVKDKIRG